MVVKNVWMLPVIDVIDVLLGVCEPFSVPVISRVVTEYRSTDASDDPRRRVQLRSLRSDGRHTEGGWICQVPRARGTTNQPAYQTIQLNCALRGPSEAGDLHFQWTVLWTKIRSTCSLFLLCLSGLDTRGHPQTSSNFEGSPQTSAVSICSPLLC
ncbi:hypothetical protein BDV12DRAFT_12571 [Aspergillus spectabilis]